MREKEGIIKYRLDFAEKPCPRFTIFKELEGWRRIHHRLGVIGRDPNRYGGHAFGNISARCPCAGTTDSFLITGTGTGGMPTLRQDDYALVIGCSPTDNVISATGLQKPSSEAITHAQVYQLASHVTSVVHGHCPEIWHKADQLDIAHTSIRAAYGTAAMAVEIERLFQDEAVLRRGIFVMGGHEDGVVSFGASPREASEILLATLAHALM